MAHISSLGSQSLTFCSSVLSHSGSIRLMMALVHGSNLLLRGSRRPIHCHDGSFTARVGSLITHSGSLLAHSGSRMLHSGSFKAHSQLAAAHSWFPAAHLWLMYGSWRLINVSLRGSWRLRHDSKLLIDDSRRPRYGSRQAWRGSQRPRYGSRRPWHFNVLE